ncbi:MAG: MBL fold metallo-hydrolase [Candidatus Caldarchaeum sp.]
MRATVYGGAGRIGGNKILLEEEGRVFLDFGVDFNARNAYFSMFLRPRSFALVEDYVLTGVVPAIKGLYGDETTPNHLRDEQPFVEAVVVSHGHIDHYGHVGLLRPDIPVYMGEGAKALVQAREEVRQARGEVLVDDEAGRTINTFRTGDVFEAAGMRIHPVHVDHSIPAAYGLIVEGRGGAVAYTGDLRMHGPRRDMTDEFIEKCRRMGVETLIVEGTRIGDAASMSEEDVRREMSLVMQRSEDKLAAVVVGAMDFDRLSTVLKVAEENDRIPAISMHHAQILKKLGSGKLRIEVPMIAEGRIVVYLERRGTGTYSKSDYPRWMKALANAEPTVREEDVKEQPSRYILVLSKAEDIIDLAGLRPSPKSPFILATSEPHSEEQIIEMDKIKNWVELLGLEMHHIHSSGHASGPDILDLIMRVGPRKVVPVHTESPEMFVELLRREQIEVVVPRTGQSFDVV